MLWNANWVNVEEHQVKLVPVIIYIITAINSCSLSDVFPLGLFFPLLLPDFSDHYNGTEKRLSGWGF